MSTQQYKADTKLVSFDEFERYANRRCVARLGISFDDLPDVDWFDVFEEAHYTREELADMADELIDRAISE